MQLLEVIAAGGFGRVERVLLPSGEILARKVYAPSPMLLVGRDDTKLRKRFAREVSVQSALPHDMFMPIVAHGVTDEPPWFLMPLAEENLEQNIQALRSDGDESWLRFVLSQILDSLDYLHSLDYIHRDLKPSNILFHDGRWKLSDFGLVLPPTGQSTRLSGSMSGWGTLAYCAPEQQASFAKVTSAADIYSFGCILHDLFGTTSRVPFSRATCDGAIGVVIERCTDPNPANRFKSLSGLRAALFDVLAAPKIESTTPVATELVNKLAKIASFTTTDFGLLKACLRSEDDLQSKAAVCQAMDEDKLRVLHGMDADSWGEIASAYCSWARWEGFPFEYCDTIVKRLETIFALGRIAIQSEAALAAAHLGCSHNRWYVMHRLIGMCSPKLDPTLAQRIALEIRASEAQYDFRMCAINIQVEIGSYHPLIARVLEEQKPPPAQAEDFDDDVPF